MMDIKIDNGNAFKMIMAAGIFGSNGYTIKQTKAHGQVGFSMMSGDARRKRHCLPDLSALYQPHHKQRLPHEKPLFPRAWRHNRIVIQIRVFTVFGYCCPNRLNMKQRMNQSDLLASFIYAQK
jgi:hypothetical protein